MTNRRAKKKLTLALDESGATALVIAIVFTVLCGFAGLAVDIGHMVMAKAELQRTADAGALAGAMGLVPYINPGLNQAPNWLQAQSKSHTIINNAANQADNQRFTITDGTVQYGYWLLNPPTGYVQTLPLVRNANGAYLPEPAIKVTLSRNVTLYLASVVPGVSSPTTVSATATAILPEAYQIVGGVPPVAVSWDTVYNMVGGTVVIDVVEQDIKPQSNQGIAGWINLDGGNSVPSVRLDAPLIADPNGIAAGSQVYTVPGTKATLTDYMAVGQTIIIPIVQQVVKQGWESIIGWSAFKVDSLGANTMTGHFVDECYDPNVRPTAPKSGIIGAVGGTPKLVSP